MTDDAKTFTQEDIDGLTAKHQEEMTALKTRLKQEYDRKADGLSQKIRAEIEEEARRAGMSDLEKANEELNALKTKYQESQDTIALTNQKDETRKLMAEAGVDDKCLDYVFIPKDTEGTKARIKAFKEYIDTVKKETFENNVNSKIPGAGGSGENINTSGNLGLKTFKHKFNQFK